MRVNIIVLCYLLHGVVYADDWRLYTADGATIVEYRHSEAKLLQIRAATEVESKTDAFLLLLEDTDNITRWVANTEKAELLGRPDPHSHLVHTYFNAPWPVSKRDMVTQSVWSQDRSSGTLTLRLSDMGQHFPAVKGYVRMRQVQGIWTLTPLGAGRLRITYQGQADPAGRLPRFITDKVALKATLATFNSLEQALAKYQQSYPGLSEP